jgi:HK97 family phage prohead protease
MDYLTKATSSTLLPILEDRDRAWDSDSAIARVRTFTNSKDQPSAQYKKAFLYYDEEEQEDFGDYKLPIADVVDGKLVAIPRAIFSAAGAMSGSRGGVDIEDDDREKVTNVINKYYTRMANMFDDDTVESPLKSETNVMEHKLLDVSAELILKSDEEEGTFTGYASIFGNKDLGGDVVEQGAFVRSLRNRRAKKVKMLWQHKTDMPIGVYDKISEDGDGLKVSGRLALGTQGGRDAYELLKMGAIDGLSIGYKADPAKQHYDDRKRKRHLKEVDLMEISLVTFPMNPKATIQAVKGIDRTIRDWEKFLREEGNLTRSESKIVAKAVNNSLKNQWDVDSEDNKPLVSSIRDLINKFQS